MLWGPSGSVLLHFCLWASVKWRVWICGWCCGDCLLVQYCSHLPSCHFIWYDNTFLCHLRKHVFFWFHFWFIYQLCSNTCFMHVRDVPFEVLLLCFGSLCLLSRGSFSCLLWCVLFWKSLAPLHWLSFLISGYYGNTFWDICSLSVCVTASCHSMFNH